jgi:hypothetical protein
MSELAREIMQTVYRFGEPYAIRDQGIVSSLVERFRALPGNSNGGLLHIVLEDSNVEEEHIVWCREQARTAGDEAAFWLAQLLLMFTEDERWSMDWVCECCKADREPVSP